MLISPAFAQTAGAPDAMGGLMQFLPLILIFVVFYFLLIRPQQQRAKQQKAMLAAIKRGDRIVTNGGLLGLVTKAQDDELTVEIAENVRVKVLRSMVSSVVSKTEPAKTEEAAPANDTETGKSASLKRLLGIGKNTKQ